MSNLTSHEVRLGEHSYGDTSSKTTKSLPKFCFLCVFYTVYMSLSLYDLTTVSSSTDRKKKWWPLIVVANIVQILVALQIWCIFISRVAQRNTACVSGTNTNHCTIVPCFWYLMNLLESMLGVLFTFPFALLVVISACAEQCTHDEDDRLRVYCRPRMNATVNSLLLMGLIIGPSLSLGLNLRSNAYTVVVTWLLGCVALLIYSVQVRTLETACTMVAFVLFFINSVVPLSRGLYMRSEVSPQDPTIISSQSIDPKALLANLAHDLKTPLTAILGANDNLKAHLTQLDKQGNAGGDRTAKLVHVVNSATKNISQTGNFMWMMINHCLDYAKSSDGLSLVARNETIDLYSTIKLPIDIMSSVQSKVTIVLKPVDQDILSNQMITDKQWLMENLLCLLSNAAKYSRQGCAELSVRICNGSDPNTPKPFNGRVVPSEQYLLFEVQDTGIGLSDDAKQSLFRPFQQAQRLAGGTGLGLYSLSKRIEALRGHYGVCDRYDGKQGCVFWFTIPYRVDMESTTYHRDPSSVNSISFPSLSIPSDSAATGGAGASLENSGPMLNVLLAEDSAVISKIVSSTLLNRGNTVTIVTDGLEAVTLIEESYRAKEYSSSSNSSVSVKEFDVVLMDLQMPVMDGLESIKRIRKLENELKYTTALSNKTKTETTTAEKREYHQLIIAVSANADSETIKDAISAGADGFLPKPLQYESFSKLVRDLRGQTVD